MPGPHACLIRLGRVAHSSPAHFSWPEDMPGWTEWAGLEWGSSTAGLSLPAARSRFLAVHSDSSSTVPLQPSRIVGGAAPLPIFRTITRTTLHQIVMNIPKLFYKIPVIPDVEIVVTLLAEVNGPANQSPRRVLLQRLERIGERSLSGLADQQVDVFRHDNVAVDAQLETSSHALSATSNVCFASASLNDSRRW